MHDLENLIAEWRRAAAASFSADTLDELETHLRETTDQWVRSGMNLPDAFQRARTDLGAMPTISSEFQKLAEPLWLPVKLAIGTTALLAFVLIIFVTARFDSSLPHLLLAAHTFTVTLGYTLTLLIGGLGICFVSQRCLQEFSTSRLRSISRISFTLGMIAWSLTTLGVLLAMIWAKIEWGRYWAWDAKETGGFSVVVWLTCYLIAHRFFKNSERGVLAISMLGNIVVSVAWFRPQVGGLHQYGYTSLMLSIVVLVNLTFFAIGFIPPGRLRFRNDQ